MTQFNEIKEEIIKRAHEANACAEQYKRAYSSESIEELCVVIKDNFYWCSRNKVIDQEFIYEYRDVFAKNNIFCNVNSAEGYILVDGNATVRACGNATVRACDNATVEACGNATVRACDNATVIAYGNVTVYAYGNATVEACDNATVIAYGNATVRACDNATVEACDNTYVISDYEIECKLNNNAIHRIILTNELHYCSEEIKLVKV